MKTTIDNTISIEGLEADARKEMSSYLRRVADRIEHGFIVPEKISNATEYLESESCYTGTTRVPTHEILEMRFRITEDKWEVFVLG